MRDDRYRHLWWLTLTAWLIVVMAGCDDFEIVPPDGTPPAAITDLAVAATSDTSVTLIWTAPGDDGGLGRASSYDLRSSDSLLTVEKWADAEAIPGIPAPLPAGAPESLRIGGLSLESLKYFALRTADEVPNWSDLSNVVRATTGDTIPPGEITDLAAASLTDSSVTLTWTATGDDSTSGTAARYDLRYSLTPLTPESWEDATAVPELPAPKAAGEAESLQVEGLDLTTLHYFALRAADEASNLSDLSNVVGVTTSDAIPPATVVDLAVIALTDTSVTLSWTASGDDSTSGTAADYDLRYSSALITEETWNAATRVVGTPPPRPAGEAESLLVTGLDLSTFHYFALKTGDEIPNWSALSNVVGATTGDTIPPGPIGDLAVAGMSDTSVTLSWSAPGDDGELGTATEYDVRFATTLITEENWSVAFPVDGEPIPRPPGQWESFTVGGLVSEVTYYFAVRTADEVPNWSTLSNVPSARTPDGTPPAAVTDLRVTAITDTSATLDWTAPGDDDASGTASEYDLRSSTAPITPENWDAATEAAGEPAPQPAGVTETMTVGGLEAATVYYFALRSSDEVPNTSDISNVPSATTLEAPPRTWRILPDGSGDAPTIQAGLDSAVLGDVVLLAPGTHRPDTPIIMKSGIVLEGEIVGADSAIIDAQGDSSVIRCDSLSSNTRIENLILTGGNATTGWPHNMGGGISCRYGSSITITGCHLRGNNAVLGGGLACDGSSSPIVTDCIFSGNTASDGGGGVYCTVSSSAALTGCTFSGNICNSGDGEGGGVHCSESSHLTLTSCDFTGNVSRLGGGFYCTNSSSPTLSGCSFTNNSAPSDGGGIYCSGGSSLILSACYFSGNSAQSNNGGGLYCASSPATVLSGCTFEGNVALNAAGIYLEDSSPNLGDCLFLSNAGLAAGGGMFCVRSSPTMNGCTFAGNTVNARGGGLYCDQESSPILTSCTLHGNSGGFQGGGLYCSDQSSPRLIKTIVAFSTRGEGVACDGTSSPILNCSDVFGNDGGDWIGCIAGQAGIGGNFSLDPLFCDPETDDYELHTDSPCLNAPGCGLVGAWGEGCSGR